MEHDRLFDGEIKRTVDRSRASWTSQPSRLKQRPNTVMIVLDDVGYSQLGCYGSDIETPALDSLAADGLRYANFHVTPLCSPTRTCLLTGRNHHSVGMGRVAEMVNELRRTVLCRSSGLAVPTQPDSIAQTFAVETLPAAGAPENRNESPNATLSIFQHVDEPRLEGGDAGQFPGAADRRRRLAGFLATGVVRSVAALAGAVRKRCGMAA